MRILAQVVEKRLRELGLLLEPLERAEADLHRSCRIGDNITWAQECDLRNLVERADIELAEEREADVFIVGGSLAEDLALLEKCRSRLREGGRIIIPQGKDFIEMR